MDAPYSVTGELIEHFHVQLVCHGAQDIAPDPETGADPYAAPKQRGIFRVVPSGSDMTTSSVIHRIIAHRLEFEERNRKKEAKELHLLKHLKTI
jgi:ethanolamine-phosphate cytidylyltransferase